MTVRKWLAWKLVQLAHRLHDPEWYESITIRTSTGRELRIDVIGDEYGCGIGCTSGIHWTVGDDGEAAEEDGWSFAWSNATRYSETVDQP